MEMEELMDDWTDEWVRLVDAAWVIGGWMEEPNGWMDG